MQSATSATRCAPSASSASVTIGSPVSRRARASSSSPFLPRPWKEYGELRGLNAPPRNALAPASRTCCAASTIWCSFSTEQGPAMIGMSLPPKTTPGAIVTSVFSWRHSRDTCLYGRETWMISATPSSDSKREPSTRPSLPTRPTVVRCAPGMGRPSYPISVMTSTTRATCASVARVVEVITEMGYEGRPMPGAQRTTVGLVGNDGRVDGSRFESLDGVAEIIHVSRPYKQVSREWRQENTLVTIAPGVVFGGKDIPIIAGPCSFSTEQGPAMIGMSLPPKTTPGAIVTSVFSWRHSRDTCLYGRETWMISATPSSDSKRDPSTRPSLPTRPTVVRCAPGMGRPSYPISVMTSTTRATEAQVARVVEVITEMGYEGRPM